MGELGNETGDTTSMSTRRRLGWRAKLWGKATKLAKKAKPGKGSFKKYAKKMAHAVPGVVRGLGKVAETASAWTCYTGGLLDAGLEKVTPRNTFKGSLNPL